MGLETKYKVKIDGIDWYVYYINGFRNIQPLCSTHNLRMYPVTSSFQRFGDNSFYLSCEECIEALKLPRMYANEKRYVNDKIDSKIFKDMQLINIDDEAVPLVKQKTKNTEYFVTAQFMESKVGKRLVVYVGKKGEKNKTQIFIEPEIKRMSFDQRDIHPLEVFTSLEATFPANEKVVMRKEK